jgi:hypothetical protein
MIVPAGGLVTRTLARTRLSGKMAHTISFTRHQFPHLFQRGKVISRKNTSSTADKLQLVFSEPRE